MKSLLVSPACWDCFDSL